MPLENPPPKRRLRYSILIKRCQDANNLSDPLDALPSLRTYEKDEKVYTFECKRVSDIKPEVMKWILELEETNMKVLYEESEWGWNLRKKTREMTHRMAWYLLVKSSDGSYVAFSHFRFDLDYGSVVLYCYEIQLEERVRRVGLGRQIMYILDRLAYENYMEKVVLTVFKANTTAIDFFSSLNFRKDSTSPDEIDKDCFYCILSKVIDNDNISEEEEMQNFIREQRFAAQKKDDNVKNKGTTTNEGPSWFSPHINKIVVKTELDEIVVKTEVTDIVIKTEIDDIVLKTEIEECLGNSDESESLDKTDNVRSLDLPEVNKCMDKTDDIRNLDMAEVNKCLEKTEINKSLDKTEVSKTTKSKKSFNKIKGDKVLDKTGHDKGLKKEINKCLEKTEGNGHLGRTKDNGSVNGPMEVDRTGNNGSMVKTKSGDNEILPMDLGKTENDGNVENTKNNVIENGPMELDKTENDESSDNSKDNLLENGPMELDVIENGPMELDMAENVGSSEKTIDSIIENGRMELVKAANEGSSDKIKSNIIENGPMELDKSEEDRSMGNIEDDGS